MGKNQFLFLFFIQIFFRSIKNEPNTTILEVHKSVELRTSTPCHVYELPANYQILNFEFQEHASIVKRIMISDRQFDHEDNCDNQTFSSCNPNSSYCLSRYLFVKPKFYQ